MIRPSRLALPLLAVSVVAAAAPTFVDPAAPEGGDGTRQRPHRRLEDALRPGAEVHLLPGTYVGTWTVPARVKLRGGPGVALEAPAGSSERGVLLDTSEGVTLEHVELRRGRPVIRARGPITLRGVVLHDVTSIGVELLSGTLEAKQLRIVTAAKADSGLRLSPGTRSSVAGLRCEGAFARAVEAAKAALTLEDVQVNGAITAIHLENVILRASRIGVFDPGVFTPPAGSITPGAALFIAGGEASLADVFVTGHEYALLLRNAKVRLTRFGSLRVRRGAITGVGAELSATGVTIAQPGPFGAVQLNGGRTNVSGLLVTGWREQAVWLRGGDLHLSGATILAPERTSPDDATAVSARIGRLTADHLRVHDAAGACLLSADDGNVSARGAVLHACGWGLAADGVGSVRVSTASVGAKEAVAVAVAGGRVLMFGASVTPGGTAALEADCTSSAFVLAQGLRRPSKTRAEDRDPASQNAARAPDRLGDAGVPRTARAEDGGEARVGRTTADAGDRGGADATRELRDPACVIR